MQINAVKVTYISPGYINVYWSGIQNAPPRITVFVVIRCALKALGNSLLVHFLTSQPSQGDWLVCGPYFRVCTTINSPHHSLYNFKDIQFNSELFIIHQLTTTPHIFVGAIYTVLSLHHLLHYHHCVRGISCSLTAYPLIHYNWVTGTILTLPLWDFIVVKFSTKLNLLSFPYLIKFSQPNLSYLVGRSYLNLPLPVSKLALF